MIVCLMIAGAIGYLVNGFTGSAITMISVFILAQGLNFLGLCLIEWDRRK